MSALDCQPFSNQQLKSQMAGAEPHVSPDKSAGLRRSKPPQTSPCQVSVFPSVTAHSGTVSDIAIILRDIRSGRWRAGVERARGEYSRSGKSSLYSSLKKKLPAFTPAGVFTQRRISGFVRPSGIVQGDVDELTPAEIERIMSGLRIDPYIVYAFLSPSGFGIKYGLRIPTVKSDAEYRPYFFGACDYVRRVYGFEPDEQNEAISQACYVSYDPQAYFNPAAEVFTKRRSKKAFSLPATAAEPTNPPAPPPKYAGSGQGRGKALWACQVVREAKGGTLHQTRRDMGRLVGGWIQGGIAPPEATEWLVEAAQARSATPAKARREVLEAIEQGRQVPITHLSERHRSRVRQKPKSLGVLYERRKSYRKFTR